MTKPTAIGYTVPANNRTDTTRQVGDVWFGAYWRSYDLVLNVDDDGQVTVIGTNGVVRTHRTALWRGDRLVTRASVETLAAAIERTAISDEPNAAYDVRALDELHQVVNAEYVLA